MERSISELIEVAKTIMVDAAHREEQRRSFVFGNTAIENPSITRELVDRIADEMARAARRPKKARKSPKTRRKR